MVELILYNNIYCGVWLETNHWFRASWPSEDNKLIILKMLGKIYPEIPDHSSTFRSPMNFL